MLNNFTVSAKTDGETRCIITVIPDARQADATVTVRGLIVAMGAEDILGRVKSFTGSEWSDFRMWEHVARDVARAHSPFWRGEVAA